MDIKKSKEIGLIFILTLILLIGSTSAVLADDTANTEATVTFTVDPGTNILELVSAPAIDFGTHPLPDTGTTYNAVQIENDLIVDDDRGLLTGWTVTGQLGNFTASGGAVTTLEQSRIVFQNPSLSNSGASYAPVPSAEVILTPGGNAETFMTASSGSGAGEWTLSWTNPNIQLFANGLFVEGLNTATIDWTALATPTD